MIVVLLMILVFVAFVLASAFVPKEWKLRDNEGSGVELWTNGRTSWIKVVNQEQHDAHMRELLKNVVLPRYEYEEDSPRS